MSGIMQVDLLLDMINEIKITKYNRSDRMHVKTENKRSGAEIVGEATERLCSINNRKANVII